MTPFKNIAALACLGFFILQGCALRADDLSSAPVPARPIQLFNGKDLVQWVICMRSNAVPAQTWLVTNGVIHCTGKGVGYIRSMREFHDFTLDVEWRFVKMAPKADNTGVLVHMQLPDKVWPMCVQVQGKHDHQGDLFVMAGAECKEHQGKDANTPVVMRGDSAEKPVGEWNTSRTICAGDNLKAYINDRLMNEITGCTVTNGFVGFQSEGADFEIRRVTLTPLPQ